MTVDIETQQQSVLDFPALEYAMPAVNLLPPEIIEAKRVRRSQVIAGLSVAAALGLLAGGFVWASADRASANEDLQAEQAVTAQLKSEQAKYAEVPRLLGQIDAAKQAQATVMENDVAWSSYLNSVSMFIPNEVWLEKLTASVGGDSTGDPFVAGNAIGSIQVSGVAMNYPSLAAWLEKFESTQGYQKSWFSSSTREAIDDQGVVKFSSDNVMTTEARSNRHRQSEGE